MYKFEVSLGHHHGEVLKIFPKNGMQLYTQKKGSIDKKILSHLADRFWQLDFGLGWGLRKSVKKGKFMTKIFLSDNIE